MALHTDHKRVYGQRTLDLNIQEPLFKIKSKLSCANRPKTVPAHTANVQNFLWAVSVVIDQFLIQERFINLHFPLLQDRHPSLKLHNHLLGLLLFIPNMFFFFFVYFEYKPKYVLMYMQVLQVR